MHPVISQQSQSLVPTSPLQLVAQLRGDYNAFTEDVYGESNSQGSLEDFRVRRQRERLQLDSLHARLHGLRLILAMAQLQVAAESEMERVEFFGAEDSDDPSVFS